MRMRIVLCVSVLVLCLLHTSEAKRHGDKQKGGGQQGQGEEGQGQGRGSQSGEGRRSGSRKGSHSGERGGDELFANACLELDGAAAVLASRGCRDEAPCEIGPLLATVGETNDDREVYFCDTPRLDADLAILETITGLSRQDVLGIDTVFRACAVDTVAELIPLGDCRPDHECTFDLTIDINGVTNDLFYCQDPANPALNILDVFAPIREDLSTSEELQDLGGGAARRSFYARRLAGARRHEGQGPSGEHPSGEHPSGERPSGDGPPSGEHPSGEHPSGEHPSGEHPSGEHPSGEHPSGERIDGNGPPKGNGSPKGNGPPKGKGPPKVERRDGKDKSGEGKDKSGEGKDKSGEGKDKSKSNSQSNSKSNGSQGPDGEKTPEAARRRFYFARHRN